MNPDKIAELRIKMENELELLFNQAQRRGSSRPSPSQIVDCMFNTAVEFIVNTQRLRKPVEDKNK